MRGGKRIGAGRPKSQTAKRSVQIRIPEHLADRLPKRPAALIEKLLINHFKSTTMSELKIVNLTPHNVSIFDTYDVPHTFEKSGMVARVSSRQSKFKKLVTSQTEFDLYANEFGDAYIEHESGEQTPMFRQQDGVYYIVSSFVAQALPHRTDLICPNSSDAVRNEKGHIMHTNGFMLP
jgi:hypothetical protein